MGSSQPSQDPAKKLAKPTTKNLKELQYFIRITEDTKEGTSQPFCLDVLAQLTNILARITFYELLKLSKETREAFMEALEDVEIFLSEYPPSMPQEEIESFQVSQHSARNTFFLEDKQI